MLKLYNSRPSVCSQKVRIGLDEIGLDYECTFLNLQTGDQYDAAYLKLNPSGQVPTLIDDDLILVESSLILEYIDRTYNDNQLMPKGQHEEVVARHWLLRCIAIHAAINTLTFATAFRDMVRADKTEEEIAAQLTKMPDPVMRLKRRDLLDNGVASPYVEQALGHLKQAFEDMVKNFKTHPWLSGPEFGIADIALTSYIDRLEKLGFAGLWAGENAGVGRWLDAVRARPSYVSAITELTLPGADERMREDGTPYWPEISKIWQAL